MQTSLKAEQAGRLESAGKALAARVMFDECLFYMEGIHHVVPNWEPSLVQAKIDQYRGKVAELKAPAAQEALKPQNRDLATLLFEEASIKSARDGGLSGFREFEKAFMIMTLVRERDSNWQSESISKNFESCRTKLATMRSQILANGAGDSTL